MDEAKKIADEIKKLKNRLIELNRTKEEMLADVWKLPELTPGMMDLIKTQGFRTGSVECLEQTDAPDEDWVVNAAPSAFGALVLYCSPMLDSGSYISGGFEAVYGHYQKRIINIICVSAWDVFIAWYRTTAAMKLLFEAEEFPMPQNNMAQAPFLGAPIVREQLYNKYNRVRLFQAFLDIFSAPNTRKTSMSKAEAIRFQRCVECNRPADHFIDKKSKDLFLESGICGRCQLQN